MAFWKHFNHSLAMYDISICSLRQGDHFGSISQNLDFHGNSALLATN